MDIDYVDKEAKKVYFDNGEVLDHETFMKKFIGFLQGKIAAETLIPADTERFMRRTSAKNLKLLMKGKKMEGYLEGSMDKFLTKGQKIALASVAVLVIGVAIALVILKNNGLLPI